MIELFVYGRPNPLESVESRYEDVAARMKSLGAPLGWADAKIPPVPRFESDDLSAHYEVRYPSSAIQHQGYFHWRDREHLSEDHAAKDDSMSVALDSSIRPFYQGILHTHFPKLVEAFSAYRGIAYYKGYIVPFHKRHEKDLEKLRSSPGVNVNGRNNIFTLSPAHYWDAELCLRALGYDCDEVIRRLDGKVPLVKPLMDGVYVVFNDNPDLTFEEFCAMNDRFKPILELA